MTAPYQLLPPLAPDEYAALRADIEAHGIRVPIDVDEHGQILDGHHRAAIAGELGVDCPTRVLAGLTEDDKRAHAVAVNVHRRALTREQRRELVAAELTRDPSRSDRAIGRICGVDGKTVAAVRNSAPKGPPTEAEIAELLRLEREAQDHLNQADATILEALLKGDSPHDVAALLAEAGRSQHGPKEFTDVFWQVIIWPRIQAVYQFPADGYYRELGLEAIAAMRDESTPDGAS